MKVSVHLLSQAQPIQYIGVKNTYTKDGMYCLYLENGIVHKYAMVGIFRVEETYNKE